MNTHTLTTEAREQTGKAAARQLRNRGLVPAVYYGPGQEPAGLAVSPKELTAALSTQFGRNALIRLQVAGTEVLAMVQDLQIHPVTRKPVHVDFYRVDGEQPIERRVPFTADGKAKGVVAGGGVTLLYASQGLGDLKPLNDDQKVGIDIVRRALQAPARQIYANADRVIVCWAMGLTQHANAVATIQEVMNFLLLRGNIGRPGAGVCPVRGHSNVQGDRTMGIWEKMPPAFLDALGTEFGFTPPAHHGYDVVEAIRAMRDGQAKVFMSLGGLKGINRLEKK